MSVVDASTYAREMVRLEASRVGNADVAMSRLEAKYGISRWQLDHLRKNKAKTCDVSLYARIRAAYIDLCERQVTKLQHEISIEKALNADDALEDLEREARSLAARIAAKKEARRAMK
jgi:hypothetical protein